MASAFSGLVCKGVVQHGGTIYVLASDDYVYRQAEPGSMEFSKYPLNRQFTSPIGLVSHSSGLYVVCEGGIHRYV